MYKSIYIEKNSKQQQPKKLDTIEKNMVNLNLTQSLKVNIYFNKISYLYSI
jgi:flagellar basal body rod protein FlgG